MAISESRSVDNPAAPPEPSICGGTGMVFHHFGMLSARPEQTRQLLTDLGYLVMDPVVDPLQNVRLYWASHPAFPAVEIISPTDTPGAVSNLLKSVKQGVYHLCFEVADLAATLAQLSTAHQVRLVSDSKPAVLFGGRRVSFHFIDNFGLIELLEPADTAA